MKKSMRLLNVVLIVLLLLMTLPLRVRTARAANGVDLVPTVASVTAEPGTDAEFKATIYSTSSTDTSYKITIATCSQDWSQTIVQPGGDVVSITPNANAELVFTVSVPPTASPNFRCETIVTVADNNNTASTASATFTVTTPQVTQTPKPSATLPPPPDLSRPVLQVRSYFNAPSPVVAGAEFDMVVNLVNTGAKDAKNVFVRFEGSGVLPRDTGGMLVVQEVRKTETAEFRQPMVQVGEIAGSTSVPITANVSYTDETGEKYSESFVLALPVAAATQVPASSGSWATPTPTGVKAAQFMISKVTTSVDPLQPGTVFDLTLDVHNLGNADARNVTMVLGGATESTDNSSGTPQPGGIAAGASDLSKFAPLGSSNLVYLGDVPNGAIASPTIKLVVNVNTDPGAYPLRISFVYIDAKNNRKVDDQVITLLVYSLPKLEASFYTEPQPIMMGMPGNLPIQITNLGKKNVVLGNITITSPAGTIQNGKSLVGSLDPGGYFTLDAMLDPTAAGEAEIVVTIDYNDDFSQPRVFTKSLKVTVESAPPTPDPASMQGMEDAGMMADAQPETFWQKVVRFFKGLFGLGSDSPSGPVETAPGEMPPDNKPVEKPLG